MKALRQHAFEPDYAVPPGFTLEETMESLGMTQRELAKRTGLTVQSLNRIFKGEQPITTDTATILERVTNVPAGFWNNLEARYREQLARMEALSKTDPAAETWARQFNYAKMATAGWVPSTTKIAEKIENLLQFFQVGGIAEWEEVHLNTLNQGAYRTAAAIKEHRTDTVAWIQRGITLARGLKPAPFDKARFQQAIQEARELVVQHPKDVARKLESLYRDAGVALVFLDTLPGMGVHGYARWIKGGDFAVILHGMRHKSNDHFWFDLFHETAHILLHGRSHEFLEYDGHDDPREAEANQWAGKLLIPDRAWNHFLSTPKFTATAIRDFAAEQNVHPGTVVGRLQKEKRLRPENHASLRIFIKESVPELTTSPARHRINRARLGTGAAFIRKNRGIAPSMPDLRESLTKDDHENLRR
jgi:HTH-type transcriptional regulator / antitoxin HigA